MSNVRSILSQLIRVILFDWPFELLCQDEVGHRSFILTEYFAMFNWILF